MPTKSEKYGDVVVISVESEFSGDTVRQFRATAEGQTTAENLWFVIDLEKTSTIDSGGLEALLWFRDRVEGNTGLVKVCGLDETCAKIFELTRFDRKFEVFPSVSDAVESYGYGGGVAAESGTRPRAEKKAAATAKAGA
jgi:anti-sigma B factor antagonist